MNPGVWLWSRAPKCVFAGIRDWMEGCIRQNLSFVYEKLTMLLPSDVLEGLLHNRYSVDGPIGVLIEPRSRIGS